MKKKRYLQIGIIALTVLILLGVYHDRRTCWGSNDFDTYYFAGKLVLSGENLYTHEVFKTTMSPYLYLPFFAVIISPLSALNIRIAASLWYLISVVSLGGAVYFSARIISGKEEISRLFFAGPYLLKIVSFVFVLVMWIDNVSLAQVDFLIFFLIVLALFLNEKGRDFLAGMLIAAVAVIKIYPAYFLIYFFVKKRFKVLAGAAFGMILFLVIIPWAVLGTANFNDSMKSWIELRAAPHLEIGDKAVKDNFAHFESQLKPKNQALSAVVTRYFIRDDEMVNRLKIEDFEYRIYWPHQMSPREVDILVKALMAVVFTVTFLLFDYRNKIRTRIYMGLEYSLVFLSVLSLFPMVKSHTFAPILFPVLLLTFIRTADQRQNGWIGDKRIVDGIFYAAIIVYSLQGIEYMQVLGAGCYSVLILWGLFAYLLCRYKKSIVKGEITDVHTAS